MKLVDAIWNISSADYAPFSTYVFSPLRLLSKNALIYHTNIQNIIKESIIISKQKINDSFSHIHNQQVNAIFFPNQDSDFQWILVLNDPHHILQESLHNPSIYQLKSFTADL